MAREEPIPIAAAQGQLRSIFKDDQGVAVRPRLDFMDVIHVDDG
jgi:hypothetical protein